MDQRLQTEIDARLAGGAKQVTLAQLCDIVAELGYKVHRDDPCRGNSRYMTGPRAGATYPAVSFRITEADTGLGFTHVDARRDGNFKRLQELRLSEEYFAVSRGHITNL